MASSAVADPKWPHVLHSSTAAPHQGCYMSPSPALAKQLKGSGSTEGPGQAKPKAVRSRQNLR